MVSVILSSTKTTTDMKKQMQSPRLHLTKKNILPLNTRQTQQVQGGVDTKVNCPPSVGCTRLQVCITCNCPY